MCSLANESHTTCLLTSPLQYNCKSHSSNVTAPKLAPSIQKPEPKLEEFYVHLEHIWFKGDQWKKVCNIEDEDIIIVGCTETTTIDSFIAKCKKKNSKIQPDNTWRVFFPNRLPDYFIWRFSWDKRKDYLLDFTDGKKTLGDIGIGPDTNHLVYFHQFQLETRDEP